MYLYYAETLDELPPDSEPPRVSLLAPADGVSVSGVIPLEVDTSDNTGVLRVTYQLNGEKIAGAYYIDPFTTAWNTTRTANGTYILTAKAFDYRGNWTESSAITFSIDNIIDETPPEITLVRPGDGETVSGTTVIEASATDNVAIREVEFYFGGHPLETVYQSPYQVTLDTTDRGKRPLPDLRPRDRHLQ